MTVTAADRPSGPGLLIGLTGPIGCGKSTVGRWLADLGASVIDADQVTRAVTGRGEATLDPIRARFGATVFREDGELDRAALASVVFDDAAALADLESIVHPAVRKRVVAAVAAARQADAPIVVIEAIKLVEGGYAVECDEVWLVTCTPTAQRDRLLERGMRAEDAARRLAAQGPDLIARLAAALAASGAARGTGPRVRTIPTDGATDETVERVEEALADALEPLFFSTEVALDVRDY